MAAGGCWNAVIPPANPPAQERMKMIQRISVNLLLKSVILTLSAAAIVMLSIDAWNSWNRQVAVKRIAGVVETSANFFTALHNLRVDRATGFRELNADRQLTTLPPQLRAAREAEVPALKAGLAAMATVDFPGQKEAVEALDRAIKKLLALHQEWTTAVAQPKASRRPTLAKEYFDELDGLIRLLDKLSTQLTTSVKLEDAYIDQLLQIKQLAWVVRNAGGDSSVLISNRLGGQALPPDALLRYTTFVSRTETAWTALEDVAAGLVLPERFHQAVAKAKQEYFAADYAELRQKTLKSLIANEPVTITVADWTPMSISKLASLLNVADVALDIAKEHAVAQRSAALTTFTIVIVLLGLAVVLAAGTTLLVTRRVTGPLRAIQQAMLKVAGGDFSVVLPGLDRKDEIGDVANAVERFKVLADEKARRETDEATQRMKTESARQAEIARLDAERQEQAAREQTKVSEEQGRAVKLLAEGLKRLSEGELTFRLNEGFTEAYQPIRDNFNSAIVKMQETITGIKSSAREVTNASNEISTSTTDLSQRTEEQAASLEQTSASMEQISATVKKNAENAQAANQSAGNTREVADRGGEVVAKAVQAMAKIAESSRQISDIIGVIDEIARQTNLLALNAAVEAARAGDAGRGFAVVAAEVRSLAQRSSQAAKDIKDLITNSGGQVEEGVDLVNKAGEALHEIVASIKTVAEIVSGIATASNEQAGGIDQVNKALSQMDEVTQQNSALVEENAATAKVLEQQARAMDERVSFFRLDAASHSAAPVRGAAAAHRPPVASPAAARPQHNGSGARSARTGRTQGAVALKDDPDWKEF
jgi:methyl-accepting chemotaxis protein